MSQNAPHPSLLNSKLGNYEVHNLLGRGGMASVYRAYDPALDREVAIKVISTAGQPPDFVARFQREARVVARLRHPNIVQIYSFGESQDQDVVYMVQELLPGTTLSVRIREMGRRRMSVNRVQEIIDQLASALDFAHSQDVIHRDVKPSNALYNEQGELVLTDFGIARSAADETRTTTEPGVLMGTPSYVAPEQAVSSAALTSACDIYALGVILFQLLTGRLPFEADTPMGVLLKHLYDEPPSVRRLRSDLSEEVAEVVSRSLHKEPKQRFRSAGELADALRAAWPPGRLTSATTNIAKRASSRKRATPNAQGKTAKTSGSRQRTSARSSAVPMKTKTPAQNRSQAVSTSTLPFVKRDTARSSAGAPTVAAKTATPTRATPQKERKQKTAKRTTPKRTRNLGLRFLVGLFTVAVVGVLILYGTNPDVLPGAFNEVWLFLQQLISSFSS
ncbi:MAG: hypothetical protein GFH27_549285n270 [Chloroflexi bacterium AL-W]|nr:hypothetical protein [Chloroflexi bacterium AL-N1]NOK65782.1 hypothetical protein [Chloroflexi bacterium AL-N10]NOK74277.1 hypothetical protein [Chloroflexi bacterium AL-N5]NOK80815.1 hypothetical protein [Chloroflexi bacterium AL-W]NOK88535.1 hypothetical protein [Chloroflexi bacterium AL-N15]